MAEENPEEFAAETFVTRVPFTGEFHDQLTGDHWFSNQATVRIQMRINPTAKDQKDNLQAQSFGWRIIDNYGQRFTDDATRPFVYADFTDKAVREYVALRGLWAYRHFKLGMEFPVDLAEHDPYKDKEMHNPKNRRMCEYQTQRHNNKSGRNKRGSKGSEEARLRRKERHKLMSSLRNTPLPHCN
jgi:hypothetical protein